MLIPRPTLSLAAAEYFDLKLRNPFWGEVRNDDDMFTSPDISYEIDVTQPARYAINGQLANPNAQRIRNLSFGGKPIDPQARFIVATNNYRAYGGGNFPGVTAAKVVLDAPDENRQALVDYLSQSAGSKINPSADGNWRIAPTGTVEATFLSSSNAARFLAQHPGIRLVKDNGDGTHTCTKCGATEGQPFNTNSALELRVVDAEGMDQPFTVSQNGTLRTYTGAYDTATLTGDLNTLRYLQDHGAQTIQFVTNGQTSSFAINDLLAQGSGSEVFYLTHRGAEEPTLLLVEADHSELVKD